MSLNPNPGQTPAPHEQRDLPLSAMKKYILIVPMTIIVAFAFITLVYGKRVLATRAGEPKAQATAKFPKPQLQAEPRQDLYTYKAHANAKLSSYSKQGALPNTVRVPIDRAIDEMTKDGAP